MGKLVFIALGGALGALLRYGVARAAAVVSRASTAVSLPWGTLAANLLGCLAIGVLWTVAERQAWAPEMRAFLLVGLLGAFTTFSTYSLECIRLVQDGAVWRGAAYLLASNALGLGLVALGMAAARHAFGSGSA